MADHHHVVSQGLAHLDSRAQKHAQVSALEGGWFTLPLKFFVAGAAEDERSLVPSLSFIITYDDDHRGPKHILFDLGLRQNVDALEKPIQDHLKTRQPVALSPDVRESLAKAGLGPDDIDRIILSHIHWDHMGTPLDFPKARFLLGAGSLSLLKTGLNSHMSHSHFQSDLFNSLDVQELPSLSAAQGSSTGSNADCWTIVGGLYMLELNGSNGSVYVIDLPGHLSGHTGLLVHTGPQRWVLLAGDACHDARILSGEREIAEWEDTSGRICCIHSDKAEATKTLETLRRWLREARQCGYDFEIILAHDADWAKAHPEAFFPGNVD
ncbi:hypothetical protein LQW54_000278 [Pestalotiopsis sp. IQ-011]